MRSETDTGVFSLEVPEHLIARHPPAERHGGRLFVLGGGQPHRAIVDLPGLLRPGDLLVVNNTRVLPARLTLRRRGGGAAEALLLQPGPGPVPALLRPSRRLRAGEALAVLDPAGQPAGWLTPLHREEDGTWQVRCEPEPEALMQAAGELPLPPYLERRAEAEDAVRYQTVFASEPGAVAAPTAGLHLSEAVLAALADRGVEVAPLTLHVGLGTFLPLRPEQLAAGRLHAESYTVPPGTREAVQAARARGGRVIAVGTTSLRALESAADPDRVPRAGPGRTDLFIRPGYTPRCVDGLLTNFHLPNTSLILLVCAIGGQARVEAAYREAVRLGYRFYSYGDAMLLL